MSNAARARVANAGAIRESKDEMLETVEALRRAHVNAVKAKDVSNAHRILADIRTVENYIAKWTSL